MSTSYFMNIGAYVATVIFAAARLAVGGVLTEPGALVPALLVLGILLIPLASKGGFQKSTYQTGPAFGLAWGVLMPPDPGTAVIRPDIRRAGGQPGRPFFQLQG